MLDKTICQKCKGNEWTADDDFRFDDKDEKVVFCPETEVCGVSTIEKVPYWCRYAVEQVVSQNSPRPFQKA